MTATAVHRRGAVAALAAAVLFGASPPFAKLLLPETGPVVLAALLYFGAGAGLAVAGWLSAPTSSLPPEAPLRRADLPLLVGIVAAGGVAAPFLMLYGLARVSGVAGSLLLNLESPMTMLLAVALFGEHVGRRPALGGILIALGAIVLGRAPGDVHVDWIGAAAISAACLCWAIDNNLTQRLSLRDPLAIVRTKGFSTGAFMLALGVGAGASAPSLRTALAALALGFVSYGLSLVFAVRAMRVLGAARQASYFATAPFVGAVVAMPVLGESLGPRELAAGALMAVGVSLLLGEVHGHWHEHEPLEHDHAHVHDEHHRHVHAGVEASAEPHAHAHLHPPQSHAHPHVPDAHHRHRH